VLAALAAAEEAAYFKLIGVQQRLTTFGQVPGLAHLMSEKSIGWTYSVADFDKLGVGNIRVVNPPWKPGFVNSDTQVTLIKAE